jgi:phosphinothricin acetyltransferase
MIRKAELKDVPAITNIYNDAILHSTATFDTEVKSIDNRIAWFHEHPDKYPIVVAEEHGEVVGFASMTRWSDRAAYDDTAEISIYIQQTHRGKGLGNILMQTIIQKGKEGGLHCILSRITEGNDMSIHLHKKYGFETVGVLKQVGRKFNRLLDVTMMQLLYQQS